MTDAADRPALLPGHRIDLRTRGLRKPLRFDLAPDAAGRAAVAAALGLIALPAFRLQGLLRPAGKDVVMEAALTATAVQPCSVTLDPVTTRIDEPVTRRYVADWVEPEGDEVEVPEDVTVDPLPQAIDLSEVAVEALALALPLYPRAPGADLGEAVFAPPGVAPLRGADLRPFAGLAALKDRLAPTGAPGDMATDGRGHGADAAPGDAPDDTPGETPDGPGAGPRPGSR